MSVENGHIPGSDFFDGNYPHKPHASSDAQYLEDAIKPSALIRHELFDGYVPYTEFHSELLEKQRSQNMIRYVKEIQRGNMKSSQDRISNLPQ